MRLSFAKLPWRDKHQPEDNSSFYRWNIEERPSWITLKMIVQAEPLNHLWLNAEQTN